jgi:dTDP-4-amino-4,6-dideoxygalactose transaminase
MSTTIPFLALAPAHAELENEIEAAALRVLRSGWYVGGPENERFESHFAAYCGATHAIGVANGLDALHLVLRALDVGPGDEVIVASNSYIATLLAVSMAGATPVLVEPDPATSNLDPAQVEAAITPRTKVLLPTHLYGQPADIAPLADIARRHGLRLVEDAAQAHGARYRDVRIGAHGNAVCWSFYPSKNLGAAGDAGAVTTDDAALADRVRVLGNYGSAVRYVNEVQGVNSRLDPLQAAILDVKLPHLDAWNARRTRIAAHYLESLRNCDLVLPHVPEWATPVWHLFVIHTSHRDALRTALAADGIATQIHYPIPPHHQQAYADLGLGEGSFPIAERLAAETLSLPIGPHMADDDVERVIAAVRRWADTARAGA